MRILGVFAHPDDEVFVAGGTLAKYAASGAEAMVLSATRGQAGQIRDAHAATRHTLGSVREQELRRACAILGVQQVVCLDYADGGLREADFDSWSARSPTPSATSNPMSSSRSARTARTAIRIT